MYGIEMKFTVKTLLDKGYSQRTISRKLGISRKTVKKYFDEINTVGVQVPTITKSKKLDKYKEQIVVCTRLNRCFDTRKIIERKI